MLEIGDIIKRTDGVNAYVLVPGFSILTSAQISSGGLGIITLKPWGQRKSLFQILGAAERRVLADPRGHRRGLPAAADSRPRLGRRLHPRDSWRRRDRTRARWREVARSFVSAANQRPEISGARTTFSADVPQLYVNIDRDRAETLGLSVADIYSTIGSAMGENYVNQFLYQGRVYQVRIQADAQARSSPARHLRALRQERAAARWCRCPRW